MASDDDQKTSANGCSEACRVCLEACQVCSELWRVFSEACRVCIEAWRVRVQCDSTSTRWSADGRSSRSVCQQCVYNSRYLMSSSSLTSAQRVSSAARLAVCHHHHHHHHHHQPNHVNTSHRYTQCSVKKHPLLFSCITLRKGNQFVWTFQTK